MEETANNIHLYYQIQPKSLFSFGMNNNIPPLSVNPALTVRQLPYFSLLNLNAMYSPYTKKK